MCDTRAYAFFAAGAWAPAQSTQPANYDADLEEDKYQPPQPLYQQQPQQPAAAAGGFGAVFQNFGTSSNGNGAAPTAVGASGGTTLVRAGVVLQLRRAGEGRGAAGRAGS